MRILLVNDYGFRNGGAETVILGLRDGLKARGDEVRIFAGSARSEQGFADDLCFGTESPFRILLQTANPSAVLSLKRVLESFRPDVVNLNLFLTQLSPLILPLLRDVPCVYSAHWARPVCPTGTRLLPSGEVCRERYGAVCYREGCLPLRDWVPLMAQMAMFRRWRGSIDRIVTGSEFMRRTLLENGLTGVDVIPYGLQAHAARPPLSNPPRVLFAGRLVKPKGVAVLLEAFRRVRESVRTPKRCAMLPGRMWSFMDGWRHPAWKLSMPGHGCWPCLPFGKSRSAWWRLKLLPVGCLRW